VPPQLGEAVIRVAWPGVTGSPVPGMAILAKWLMKTIILAPIGWLLLLPLFIKKITPFLGKRYVLTNRRLMIVRFGSKTPYREVTLEDIDKDGVRLPAGSYDEFFRTGTLEVIQNGQVVMRLRGVPEPEGFRIAALNACKAWASHKHVTPIEQLALASAK
jgi:hypothetical protein